MVAFFLSKANEATLPIRKSNEAKFKCHRNFAHLSYNLKKKKKYDEQFQRNVSKHHLCMALSLKLGLGNGMAEKVRIEMF